MLHIAPEPFFAPIFKAIPNMDYISGDLDPSRAMMKIDVTEIPFPDNSFDVIYCSHVLEHVPDDRKAMRELYRVLKPGGWALIAVPILRSDKTYEDFRITDPKERERAFGQVDHVRAYGPDYLSRLREAGCELHVDHFPQSFSYAERIRYGFAREDIHICRKPA